MLSDVKKSENHSELSPDGFYVQSVWLLK